MTGSVIYFFISIRTPHATPSYDTLKLYALELNEALVHGRCNIHVCISVYIYYIYLHYNHDKLLG
jgi:hypothetical protein